MSSELACFSFSCLTFSINSAKARQRLRETKWHTLRDEAIRNKSGTTPLPASLLDDVVPRGTYNPMQEQLDLDEASFGDMDDDQIGSPMMLHQPTSPSSFVHDLEAQPMESDDGHSELVSASTSAACTQL